MKALAIITISKCCCSSIKKLTINHVQLSEEKPQIKEPLKVREVKVLRPHQLCEWSVSRSRARDYTGEMGGHKNTEKCSKTGQIQILLDNFS